MLKLYNSLSQTKEEFKSIVPNQTTIYVCGITPYDTTHLGHAFTYLVYDILIRLLEENNYSVNYTQNVTDINDRDNDILKRAKEQNTTWKNLAQFWTKRFLDDMKALNWRIPSNYVKASENIEGMISLIQRILDNKFGYIVNGSVYLEVSKLSDYGKLSKLSYDQMLKRAKDFEEDIENPDKKNPLDITLWRATRINQPSHIPSFESPWGMGRPGWHIECSSMSMATLGEQIDIHGGGIDLIFPHHEDEIAQSESATNKIPFVKYWLHTASVYMNGEKMSKSIGNLVLVRDLLQKYSPNAIRWVLLSHYYRDEWEYNENEFRKADKFLGEIKKYSSGQIKNNLFTEVKNILEDDLQTNKALDLIKKSVSENSVSKEELEKTFNLLGLYQ